MESTEARLERRDRELCLELEAFGPRPRGDPLAARERDRLVAKLNAVRKLLLLSRQYRFDFGGR